MTKLTPAQKTHVEKKQAVEELNREVAMIRTPVTIYDTANFQRMPLKDFSLWYANRTYGEKAQSSATAWYKSTERREFETLVYDPSEECPSSHFNMFRGWGAKSKKGDITPWIELMDSLYGAGTAERQFAEQWDGYPIKYPGTKLRTGRLVVSIEQGVGKGAEAFALSRIYGQTNVRTDINDLHLDSAFNTWQENRQLIVVPECLVSGDARRNLANRMKDFITNPSVTINDKFKSTYDVDSCANYLFHSNHPDAMKIEDTDRRFHVHEVVGKGLKHDKKFWAKFFKWAASESGAAALRWHLEHLDYSGFNPYAPAPMTEAKEDMRDATSQPMEVWARRLKADPDSVLGGDFALATTSDLLVIARHEFADDKRTLGYLNSSRLPTVLRTVGIEKVRPKGITSGKEGRSQVKINGRNHTLWALKGKANLSTDEIRERYKPILVEGRKF